MHAILGILLALSVPGASARAAAVVVLAPPAAAVTPGALVRTAIPALPGTVREFELFLEPSEGPPVRLSPELPAGTAEVLWRVPRLAVRSARLVLRVGGERTEYDLGLSAAFELGPLPAAELASVLAGQSEAGYHLEASAGSSPGLRSGPGDEALAEGGPCAIHAELPGGTGVLARPAAGASVPAAHTPPRPVTFVPNRSSAPAFLPLRN